MKQTCISYSERKAHVAFNCCLSKDHLLKTCPYVSFRQFFSKLWIFFGRRKEHHAVCVFTNGWKKKSLSPGFILTVQNPEYIWPANYIFVHDDNVALKFRYEFNFLLEKGFLEDFFGADDIRLYSVVVVVAFSFVCLFFFFRRRQDYSGINVSETLQL